MKKTETPPSDPNTRYAMVYITPLEQRGEWTAEKPSGPWWTHREDLYLRMREDAEKDGARAFIPIDSMFDDTESHAPGVQDIRGHVRFEPTEIFATIKADGTIVYTGIAKQTAKWTK